MRGSTEGEIDKSTGQTDRIGPLGLASDDQNLRQDGQEITGIDRSPKGSLESSLLVGPVADQFSDVLMMRHSPLSVTWRDNEVPHEACRRVPCQRFLSRFGSVGRLGIEAAVQARLDPYFCRQP